MNYFGHSQHNNKIMYIYRVLISAMSAHIIHNTY